MGYRDVLNTVHENYEYIPIKPSYILQLHRDLYAYSDKTIGGHYKNVQNYISEERANGESVVRFTPLEPYETPNAIQSICDNYNKAIDDCIVDPLVLIPIFINDFLCIHPFSDGNGRMSRLLTTLLLYRCGYVVGRYVSLESKIEKNKDEYYEALNSASQKWHENDNDQKAFIKYLLGIILSAYRDFESRVDMVSNKLSTYELVEKAVSEKIGKFTKNEIMELCPSIIKASIENALKKLCEEKYIARYGNGKATYYAKNE